MKRVGAALALGIAVGAIALARGRGQAERTLPRAGISRIAWLAGTWIGKDGTARLEERWTTPAGGAMLAVSRTLEGERMTAFEFLRIVERDGGLVYIAQPGGRPPTEFRLTKIGPRSATFENPTHDFPKMICYATRADGALEASVSDGRGRGETFVFRRATEN